MIKSKLKQRLVIMRTGCKCRFNIFFLGLLLVIPILFFILPSSDKECPTIPRRDTYTVDKNVAVHWKNEYVRRYDKIICRCPSIYGDSLVYYDDKLVSYTSSVWSDTYFLNCNEKILSMMTTGDYFRTRIGDAEIFVSYLFKDKNNNIIGYSDARYELSDVIEIKDINDNRIVILEKSQLSIGWTWNITVINQDHTLSDPSILLALVGKRDFGKNSDLCNATWFIMSLLLIMFCISIVFSWVQVKWERLN